MRTYCIREHAYDSKAYYFIYLSDGLPETAFTIPWFRPHLPSLFLAAMEEQAIDRLPVEIWRNIFDTLLVVDFRSPLLQPSVPWSRRKHEFDVWAKYSEMLQNRGRLRLVAKKWNTLVETYPWHRLDLLSGLDGLLPAYPSGDVHWVVYHLGEGYAALVRSASTFALLTLTWHAKSSLTKLHCLFAHASSFIKLQELIINLTSEDRTCNDLATHMFLSHISAFSPTLVSLRLYIGLYNSYWFGSPPVLRLANLLHLDLSFGGLLGAFNISEWNCPKLTHLILTGNIENTNYLSHLASIGSSLEFLSLQRITDTPFAEPGNDSLHFNGAFWRAFPLLEVLKFNGTSWWSSDLSDLPLSHPIRELIVQHSDPEYGGLALLFKDFTASNGATEGKRKVILDDVNWNYREFESLKWNLIRTCASVALWLEDEEGVSLRQVTNDLVGNSLLFKST